MLLFAWNMDVSHFPAVGCVRGLTASVQSLWRCLVFLGLKIWNAVGSQIVMSHTLDLWI
uniref:Frizzled class receptor 3 n=1 Tax=Molossus molossus TaxID=27622 RepID=A0A7J8I719_MOLMO|nr:frizzled class receptor 3 [Molossus molossus]